MLRIMGITLCLLLAGALGGCETDAGNPPATPDQHGKAVTPDVPAPLTLTTPPRGAPVVTAEAAGIELVALRLSAAGYMLDLRYRIKDPTRAGAFLDPKANRCLIDQASGARLRVPSTPKVGALRQAPRNPDPERVCFTLFANPGRRIQRGDQLTLEVGSCRICDLVVE